MPESSKVIAVISVIINLILIGKLVYIGVYYSGGRLLSTNANKVTWTGPWSGLDGSGASVTYQGCTNWGGNDPNVCNDSKNQPTNTKYVAWEPCALGSSPGGLDPNNPATACSTPLSPTFNCLWGQNCYGFTATAPPTKT